MTRPRALLAAVGVTVGAVGAGSALGSAPQPVETVVASDVAVVSARSGGPAPVVPGATAYPPPVHADVAPRTTAPPQWVRSSFPSSYSHPHVAPTSSVPSRDRTSASSGPASPSTPSSPSSPSSQAAGPAQALAPTQSTQPAQQPAGPGSGGSGPQPQPQPQHPQPTPTPAPTQTPPKQPTPTKPPPAEPKPAPDPCADARERDWTCEVDDAEAESASGDAREAAAAESGLVASAPEAADGAAYQLVVDLGDTAVRLGTVGLDRAGLTTYLDSVRGSFPDAFLTALVDPGADQHQPD